MTDFDLKFDIRKFFGWSILLGITLLLDRLIFGLGPFRSFYFCQDYLIILNLVLGILFVINHNNVNKLIQSVPIILIVVGSKLKYDLSIRFLYNETIRFFIFEIPCLVFLFYCLFSFIKMDEYVDQPDTLVPENNHLNLLRFKIKVFNKLFLRVFLIWFICQLFYYIFFYFKEI
jgi:hypothetical protein